MVDKALEGGCIEVYIQNDQIIGFQSNDIGDGRLFGNTSLQKCSIAYSDALENILKKPEQEDNISEILENLNKIYANTIKEILWFGDDTPILEAKKQGLWPEDKILTCEKGLDELESIGYRLFYRGKNADLYIIPDTSPIEVLMVRSDRTSVFDIPLDLEIQGKGVIQTQISQLGAQFVQNLGHKTCFTKLPSNLPDHLLNRCQSMELCQPLSVEIQGGQKGLELIMRNYNTGSLYNKFYKKGIENPYGLVIAGGMQEWDKFPEPIFTPTTKETDGDDPIRTSIIETALPEVVEMVKDIFADFTQFADQRGYVIVDTKFELFQNSQGEIVFGDEILTPESSRFIRKEDFESGNYKSPDKQIIRDIGHKFNWQDKWKNHKSLNPEAKSLPVSNDITSSDKRDIINGYTKIYEAFQK